MFPEQLPQRWMAVSYGARGFAYDWWRTYENDIVVVPLSAICMALGVPPRSRRHADGWLKELVDIGAIVRHPNGLQMSAIIRRKPRSDDAQATLSEPSDDAQETFSERSEDVQKTFSAPSAEDNYAESLSAKNESESLHTERERERVGDSNVQGPGDWKRAGGVLAKLQALASSQGEASANAEPSRTNWAARYRADRAAREVAAFDRATGTRGDC